MWIDRQAEPRPWQTRLLAAGLLACGALGLALMLHWPRFMWFAGPMILPCLLLRRPLIYVRLRAMLLLSGSITAFLVIQAVAPASGFQAQLLGRLDVVCPILLALGAVAALHSFTVMTALLIVGASYGLVVLSGLAGMALGEQYTRFMVITALYTIIMIAFLHALRAGATRGATPRKRLLHAALVAFALLLSGGLLPSVRDGSFALYARMVSASTWMMRDMAASRTSRFLDLHQVVPKSFLRRSSVVMRVVSPDPPGYLKGSCYGTYRDGCWVTEPASASLPGEDLQGKIRAFRVAAAETKDSGIVRSMEVYYAPGFSSHVLHVPAHTLEVQAPLVYLRRDIHGTLLSSGSTRKTCRSFSVEHATRGLLAADPWTDADALKACTVLPGDIGEDLARLARPIFAGTDEGGTPAKLRALAAYFGQDFTYELGVPFSRDGDPVLQFLRREKRGHCSMFAAATALLLRTQGIPTRLVSGFVCAESHPGGDYWVARERTAHAWVEAFDSESRRWLLVDNTPESGRPQISPHFNHMTAWMDRLRFWRQRLAATLSQLPPGEIAALVVRQIATGVGWLLGSAGRVVAMMLLLAACATARWLRSRRTITASAAAASCAACLRDLDRLLRRSGIRRQPRQTVRRAVAEDIDNQVMPRDEFLRTVSQYEKLRYGTDSREGDHVRELRRDIGQLLRRLRRPRGPAGSRDGNA